VVQSLSARRTPPRSRWTSARARTPWPASSRERTAFPHLAGNAQAAEKSSPRLRAMILPAPRWTATTSW